MAALNNSLNREKVEWETRKSLGVVMASGGYPGNYSNNHPILGLEDISSKYGHKVFHGGTKFADNRLVTNGGRVLCVTALGDSLEDAKTSAYELVSKISWENVQYRTDIGWRAIEKNREN